MIDQALEDAADERAPLAPPIQRPERIRVRPAATVRVGRRGRLPEALVALTVVFLVLALAKPWASPPRPRLLVQEAFALPSAGPAIAGATAELEAQCGEPLGWTIFTRERWNGQMVRAWRAVEPAKMASGPLDPAVPLIRVGASIAALGYCSPWGDGERAPLQVAISAWHIVGPDAEHPAADPLTLGSVVPGSPIGLGALFGPDTGEPVHASPPATPAATPAATPGGVASGAATWALGRYVFALRTRAWERWWAVNIPPARPA